MTPNLRPIIDEIAGRADDFLAGASNRNQAKAGISELIAMDYAGLNPADRANVVAGVIAVLEDEDYFGVEYVGNPFKDADEEED